MKYRRVLCLPFSVLYTTSPPFRPSPTQTPLLPSRSDPHALRLSELLLPVSDPKHGLLGEVVPAVAAQAPLGAADDAEVDGEEGAGGRGGGRAGGW